MKFARYLEETQTPEWKRAYIDYRGLKKRITAIRLAQAPDSDGMTPLRPVSPALDMHSVRTRSTHPDGDSRPTLSPVESSTEVDVHDSSDAEGKAEGLDSPELQEETDSDELRKSATVHQSSAELSDSHSAAAPAGHFAVSSSAAAPQESTQSAGSLHRSPGNLLRAATLNMGFLPRLRRRGTTREYWDTARRSSLQWDLAKSIPLKDLLPLLSPVHRAFFDKLDRELDKVDSFYLEREKEMRTKTSTLKAQLKELQDHRRLFHELHDTDHSWLPPLIRRKALPAVERTLSKPGVHKRKAFKADASSPSPGAGPRRRSILKEHKALEEEIEGPVHAPPLRLGSPSASEPHSAGHTSDDATVPAGSSSGGEDAQPRGWRRVKYRLEKHQSRLGAASPGVSPELVKQKYDPDDYLQAKKQLKKAVLECYRGLEVLENYRTLNLIGFRKALKKFEKYTKIPAQQAYFTEKIDPSAFSSGAMVQGMISEMEELYAARFTKGDNKIAKMRLRGFTQHKTHHFSTFRTGLLLGLALPALVDGIYLSFRHDTRQAIPGYDGLLFVYSILLVPTLFSLLVGLNILVWSRSRINYVFIFELDIKTRLDHREYFEIPALMLSTLCYAFWLSFAQVGSSHFSPTLWPLLWLLLVAFIVVDPLPLFFKHSRFWLLKEIYRLLTSGAHRVEFADFWMGDQFCSLVFTLSNLFFIGCAYAGGFDEHWTTCLVTKDWGVPFVLASLPLLARFVQSIRRWVDSRLVTHLINGGKYFTGVIYYLMYYNWRHNGGARGYSFVLWCIFGTLYAVYASAWDLLMDWSVLRPHARRKFLRDELLYTNYIPLYYVAIVTNVLIRFIWVFYIPVKGPNFVLRTFIASMLEMLRRVQWNFYRLENEHLGNMDQYRVTREVPLPYTFDEQVHEDDEDEEDRKSISSWRSKRKAAKARSLHGDLPTTSPEPDTPDR
ncbi:SPX and EXS domain-containing protein [Phanerochaete sordida]|uniref:SPX and EXS domain-containing protein n=1 Tax=Phanerochaete sordida TaxID=48140 RepID=A0A9P3LH00_9APHY|nr:SPX and EXS domain-containing protein [Phanerochaete sordida]